MTTNVADTIKEASTAADKVLVELESLRRLKKLLEDDCDTVDGPDGEARPNRAMQVLSDWKFRERYEHGNYNAD